MNDQITIRGARTHNLKSIDVDIPHNALTVVSGVSGSGKSSLAFDTVYAEGQRRYVESLSAYARQFLERIEKPDVDFMDGLAPAIAIKQKNQTRNPRSTVATATEIYDYLRLLYARCGTVTCLHCGGIVKRDTVDEIVAALLALPESTRAYALFPVVRAEVKLEALQPSTTLVNEAPAAPKQAKRSAKAAKIATTPPALTNLTDTLKERLTELRRRGYNRLYQNGQIVEFSTPESLLELDFAQPIFVLIDRLALSSEIRARIVDAIETGYRESGEVRFQIVPKSDNPGEETAPRQLRYSAAFECTTCHRCYREPEPRLFSFNNPFGACPRCQGFGNTIDFDPNLIVPDKSKTLAEGAVAPWCTAKYRAHHGEMMRAANAAGIPTNLPWYDLTPAQQAFIEDGSGKDHPSFPGIRGFFAALDQKKYKLHVRVFLSKYRGYATCPDCKGQRLRAEARAVLIQSGDGPAKNICEASALTVTAAQEFFENLQLSTAQAEIAGKVLEEVRQRLQFLHQVGLDYLTLDRLSSSLSGGESQRIQLATSLGSRLVGALYVLDEPSIGLHTRDTAKLIRIMEDLRDLGNTILVVEHDPDVIRAGDYLLDLGPGAGELGGQLLAAGTVAEVTHNPSSITGKYLSGRLTIPVPRHRREPGREHLVLKGARIHNLRGVDLDIPLNLLCCVTGVSGSGKSTIVHQVLYRALMQALGQTEGSDPAHLYRELSGTQHLNEVILVDQSPIGRTPRSNPVTYIKAFDSIRELFASQPEAKRKSLSAGSFSFNVPGGRCDVCEGDGTVTVEMQFLADIELPCEECGGTRYKNSILEVKYKGRNIHDVLNMTVKEALVYFAGTPKIADKLYVLDEVGLGYVRLGQSATTLSGGEAQRVKLASHLATARSIINRAGANETAAKTRSRTLYILDEPTTGLHFDDVAKLLAAFRKLIDGGGSLLVIEHNLDVIKSADWVIDMGPEGGSGGGRIIAEGTPEEIAANSASHTGHWLKPVLYPNAPAIKEELTAQPKHRVDSHVVAFFILIFLLALSNHLFGQLAAGAADTTQPASSSNSALLTQADEAFQRRDFPAAEKLLVKLAAADPNDTHLLFDLGLTEEKLNHDAAAETAYRQAIAVDPKYNASHLALGLLLARSGKPAEAHNEVLAAAAKASDDQPSKDADPAITARALRALARIDLAANAGDARDELLSALKLSPETPDDILLSAQIADALDDLPLAETAYRRLLSETPDEPVTTAALAHVLRREKKLAEAESLLINSLAVHPGDTALTAQLSTVYLAESDTDPGKSAKAVPLAESLHQQHPENTAVTRLLARLYTQTGRPDSAAPLYKALVMQTSDDPTLLDDAASNLIQLKRSSEALPLLRRAAAQPASAFPTPEDQAAVYSHLAFAASEENQPLVTLQAIEQRATVAPNTASSIFLLATAHDKLHQVKQATEAYRQFLAMANGQFPEQESEVRHRLITLEHTH